MKVTSVDEDIIMASMGTKSSHAGHILFVDAYDSFSASIVALLRKELCVEVTTIKIDTDVKQEFNSSLVDLVRRFDALVLGPGPGHPTQKSDIGHFDPILKIAASEKIPLLGICLGFQRLCIEYGLRIERLPLPCHGHARQINHSDTDIFEHAGQVIATQYNSLGIRAHHPLPRTDPTTSIDSAKQNFLAHDLNLLAVNEEGHAMAVRHSLLPFWGFQFHPESCTSNEACAKLLRSWYRMVQLSNSKNRSNITRQSICRAPTATSHGAWDHSTSDLLSHLMTLSSGCANSLTQSVITSTIKSEALATLCYQTSQSGQIVMLESTKQGRHSIYGMTDALTWSIEVYRDLCIILIGDRQSTFRIDANEDVLAVLQQLIISRKVSDGDEELPFWGGLIGYMSYEQGLQISGVGRDIADNGRSDLIPLMSFVWLERSIVMDNVTGRTTVQSIRRNDATWVKRLAKELSSKASYHTVIEKIPVDHILTAAAIQLPDRADYMAKIEASREELMAGNSYELCLTTEGTVKTKLGPNHEYQIYRHLQGQNPAPYSSFFHLGDVKVVSSSPEKFLEWSRSGAIDMMPMKGTVPKSPDMTLEKARAILSTPKEHAENIMIADLIRHDLHKSSGRDDADVEVIKLCEVIEFEHVYQLISHIRLNPPKHCLKSGSTTSSSAAGCQALRCTLPPGSMTGAPKKRSCEILHALEQRPRGVYSGVIGYLDVGGHGCWNVCIRTATSHAREDADGQQTWRVGAGGAITVLSDTQAEWEEMMTKLNSTLRGFLVPKPTS